MLFTVVPAVPVVRAVVHDGDADVLSEFCRLKRGAYRSPMLACVCVIVCVCGLKVRVTSRLIARSDRRVLCG